MTRGVVIVLLVSLGVVDLLWINLELAPRVLAASGARSAPLPAAPLPADEPRRSGRVDGTDAAPASSRVAVVDEEPRLEQLEKEAPVTSEHVEAVPVDDLMTRWADQSVLFDETASANLSVQAERILERLARDLEREPGYDVLLRGHTDSRGSPDRNESLSQQRAQAVADYLQQRGIAARRIGTQALGASRPVLEPDGREAFGLSRRVEIVLLEGR